MVCLGLVVESVLSAPSAPAPAVYVFRPSSFDNLARTVVVSADGLAIAELASCSYTKFSLPPGKHLISVMVKPWPLDKSASRQTLAIYFPVVDGQKNFFGYYPSQLSAAELSSTFIVHEVAEGRYPHYFGIVHADVAAKAIVECTEVKALRE